MKKLAISHASMTKNLFWLNQYLKKFSHFSSTHLSFLKKNRNEGITLLSSIIISGIVLSLVLAFMRVVMGDIALNADFFSGERAYFAAESGIEHGLLELKSEPTQHLTEQRVDLSSASATLSIANRGNTETITIAPYGNTKLSLQVKTQQFQAVNVTKLKVQAVLASGGVLPSGTDVFQWKIQCRDDDQTVSIQGKKPLLFTAGNFRSWTGQFDQSDGSTKPATVQSFWTTSQFTDTEKQTCFLSFQNLTQQPIILTLSGTPFPPTIATILSTGESNQRQKIITFDIAQKNLSTLFDFGIFDVD